MNIKIIRAIALLLIFIEVFFSFFMVKASETIESDDDILYENGVFKNISLRSLEEFQSVFEAFSLNPAETLVGWDFDNTIAVITPCFFDSERKRELAETFKEAHKKLSKSEREFEIAINNLHACLYAGRAQYTFVEEASFKHVYTYLRDLEIPQLICTGMPIGENKHRFLKDADLDFSYGFDPHGHAAKHFTATSGINGVLVVIGSSKNIKLANFVTSLNKDRTLAGKMPIKNIVFIDNYKDVIDSLEVISSSRLSIYGVHYTYYADNLTADHIVHEFNLAKQRLNFPLPDPKITWDQYADVKD
jgi:hypothetical protein